MGVNQEPAAATGMTEVLSPVAAADPVVVDLAVRPATLDGRTIGLLDNSKFGADIFLARVEEGLVGLYPSSTIVSRRKQLATGPSPFIEEVAGTCDVVIAAYGD